MSEHTPDLDGVWAAASRYMGIADFAAAIEAHDRQVAAKALTDAATDAEKAAEDWRRSAADPNNPAGSAVWDTRNAEYREASARYLRKRAASLVPGNPEPTEGENSG